MSWHVSRVAFEPLEGRIGAHEVEVHVDELEDLVEVLRRLVKPVTVPSELPKDFEPPKVEIEAARPGTTRQYRSRKPPRALAPKPAKESFRPTAPTTASAGHLEGVGTWIHRQRPPYAHSVGGLSKIFSNLDREIISRRSSAYRTWIVKREGGIWSKDETGTYRWSADGAPRSIAGSAET
jgi:hypothetical protein